MARIEIIHTSRDTPNKQNMSIVDLEHTSFHSFVGGAVVSQTMQGGILRCSYEEQNGEPVFILSAYRKKPDGTVKGLHYTRTYRLLD